MKYSELDHETVAAPEHRFKLSRDRFDLCEDIAPAQISSELMSSDSSSTSSLPETSIFVLI
jgi:hypothetical protein